MNHQSGKSLIHVAIGLLLLVIAVQFVWSLLLQFKVAITIVLILICLIAVARIARRYLGGGKDWIIR